MDEKEEVRLYGENKKKDDEKWKMRRQMKEKGNKDDFRKRKNNLQNLLRFKERKSRCA